MRTFWGDCWRIWKYAVYYRISRSYKIFGWCLLAVGVILALMDYSGSGGNWRQAIGLGAGIPLGSIFIYVWMQLISATARQNSPANACLVPRLRTRIIQANILAWLVITAIATLIFGMLGPYGWCFLLCGLYLIGMGWAQVQAWVGLIGVLPSFYFMIGRQLPPAMYALVWSNTALTVGALLLPVVGYVFIQAAFPRGGERHWKQKSFLLRRAMLSARTGKASWGGRGRIWTFLQNAYARALQRACAKPAPQGMILHVLGPGFNWFTLLCLAGIAFALALCAKIGFLLFPHVTVQMALVQTMGSALAGLSMLFLVLIARQPVARMVATPTEQALFRLSPLPSLHTLNRQLANRLLRNAVQNWLIILCMIMGIAAFMGASIDALIIRFSLCCLVLPTLGIPLLDYASEARLQRSALTVWIIMAGVIVQLSVFFWAGGATHPLAWLGLALGNVLLALAVVTWRWRAMVKAPIAFPAGRMA